jgi:hypothetical protein
MWISLYKIWLWSSRNDLIASKSRLRGVTFNVLPLSSYAPSPVMLPLLETFLKFLFWNSFQCCCNIFLDIISILKFSSLQGRPNFWNWLEVTQSQIKGVGWLFHFSNLILGQKLHDSTLWAGALSCWIIQSLDQSSGLAFMRSFM